MSEHIQITIAVSESVKKNVTHHTDETLMSTLLKNNLISENFCGGTGKCGRCRVQFLQAAPLPGATERTAFSPDELRQGYRLACMARPKNNCVIRLDFPSPQKIDIITDMIEMSEDIDHKSQRLENPNRDSTSMVNHGNAGSIIAVDLGTTTIAMQLMDVETGAVLDTYCALNPQRSYGADVLSRIRAAGMGNAEELRSSVWKVLQAGVDRFCHASIRCMCIAGNTTMEHLLMGLSAESLGRSPFTPVEIGLQQCTMPNGSTVTSETLTFPVYVTPGISAFVGGDIVAGLYYCYLFPIDISHGISLDDLDGAVLFIDLGTNGEMAITDGKRMIVTATAAGPAFEGGAGTSVQGSDMIAMTASLLAKGIIDETGLLAEPYFESGITIPLPGRTEQIHLTQKDIRDLQMAKAAVRAGVEILCEKMGSPKIAKVYLAGGFGYYLDVEAAVKIGLLPESVREVTQAVGNTSLAGAFKIGRDLVTQQVSKESLEQKLCGIESVNLAEQENFESLYLGYLNFPI